MDTCIVKEIKATVQENGIIRGEDGYLIGRLVNNDEHVSFDNLIEVKSESNDVTEQPESFENKLSNLINCYSLENGSDTPDFILAEHLNNCLQVYNKTLKARTKWYG